MKKFIKLNPSQLLIVVFVVSITVGTILLKLPFSTHDHIKWIDALFIATSAMTVTGLATVDPGTTFTTFGQLIIALLIQVGGLGIMSFAVLIFIMLGKKIGLKERLLMQHALNQTSVGGIIKLVQYLFIFSITIEMIAMVFLAIRWVPQFGLAKGLFYSFFHSISAFNNAGFALWSDNLIQYVGDPIINIVISFLFIVGGIGFTVLVDVWKKRSYKKLSLHTKLMVTGTLVLNIIAMFFIFCVEYSNPQTLGSLSLGDKLWASYFQAVSPRTAGFNTVDMGGLDETTIFFIIILMFIGAGSGSTGGGIKLTTALVIGLATVTFLRGKNDIVVSKRTIHSSFILKALAITMISIVFVILGILLLNITEKEASFLDIMFEVVSAFGTVGLSTGLTGMLTFAGKQIIIFIMFLGKIGPLTLMFSLASPSKEKIRYPQEDILTG
ncbi:TrkH family potassium uptake protein [Bacillus sp. AFS040349]|uniref:TrkH family potassium uptake protein n=1 Tax=Bacillus sp. AFS040349 TaxID=2033502 RepID=UPI000BFDC5A5|nr:TrkH family potassium uptake protein [Bacillus sp. AFS040349]PGT85343.1 Ktr system potassium transporter B [Bacillus sp. AFS040349]